MLKIFLRTISVFLSFNISKKFKFDKKKHLFLENFLLNKASILFKKNPRLITHKNLSTVILNLIKEKKLKNFLRNNYIQNIFFVHNRVFIYFELKELQRDKKWKLWERLIKDNNVGNPVWYFLYPSSTGNRIRQVYILKKFLDLNPSFNLKEIRSVIEIGGGYGCMADIFHKLNKNIKFTIYDMYEVNLLQYYYLKMNKHNPKLNSTQGKLGLINNLNDLNKSKNKNLTIANWSLSEFPINFRNKFSSLIKDSNYTIISFQKNFEKINNLNFFKKEVKKLGKRYKSNFDTFDHYNNSFLNKNKHYILTIYKK